MMDYIHLAKEAVFALTEGGFLFPVLTYGVALMSAGALVLTLLHLLTGGAKSATQWASVAVWGLVAVAAGGALLIANDDLAFAIEQDLDAATHQKIAMLKTLLTWAWAGPLAVVVGVLVAAAPKSAGPRTLVLIFSVLIGAGASVYALSLVLAYQRTTEMAYQVKVDTQAELPDAWRERIDQVRSPGGDSEGDGQGGSTGDGGETDTDAPSGGGGGESDEPLQFFGLPID